MSKGKPVEEEEPKSDPKVGAMAAAKALLKAIKADDAAAADEALRLHYDLCAADEYDTEEDG